MFFTLSFCQIVKVPSIFLYLGTQNRHFLKQTEILQSLTHQTYTNNIYLSPDHIKHFNSTKAFTKELINSTKLFKLIFASSQSHGAY